MTKNEMLERGRNALAEFARLPPEEQYRRLIAWGGIDANGEVLFNHTGHPPGQGNGEAADVLLPK
jgi:hypothetical protein